MSTPRHVAGCKMDSFGTTLKESLQPADLRRFYGLARPYDMCQPSHSVRIELHTFRPFLQRFLIFRITKYRWQCAAYNRVFSPNGQGGATPLWEHHGSPRPRACGKLRAMSDSFTDPSMVDFTPMGQRFRGFLPVVVDVETGGFNPRTDALLQIAAVTLRMNTDGYFERDQTLSRHVIPFEGANMEAASLAVNGIDPWHPLRPAVPENQALGDIFKEIRRAVRENDCTRAILVGHNAAFDLSFLNAAVDRAAIKRNPFHPFSNFDTVTLAAMAYGQTVLSRAAKAAGLEWSDEKAHSASYDAERTADLFCSVLNLWKRAQDS